MAGKDRLSISIDSELSEALRAFAGERHEQLSTVVSHALTDYFASENRRSEGLAAMAEYQNEHGSFDATERQVAAERVDELMGWTASSNTSA